MSTRPWRAYGIGLATLVLGLLAGRYLWPAAPAPRVEMAAAVAPAAESATIWTCSMHPQIRQPEPGNCPICGMELIPATEGHAADDGERRLSMSASARALAEIRTSEVRRGYPEVHVRLVGKLGYDETREKSLTARFPARIDELYVNYTGIRVEAGEHLARVYSPELLTAQRELLTAHATDPRSSITRAAREKLRLWDLLPEQIDEILKRGTASDHFVLRAPIGGVVVAKQVQEGDYLKTGQPLFRIVDLSELWLTLDAYESDLTWLRYGQDVTFTVESFPGERFHGRVAFIEPEVDRRTRTVPVRVNVGNAAGRLKPGMFARGVVDARIATSGRVYAPELEGRWISPMHPEVIKDHPGTCDVCGMALVPASSLGYVVAADTTAPLIVPASAVLRTGKRAVVYVEVTGSERPTFEGREVVLGPRAGEHFLVASGLREGERVVTHGAFKIDSALQIQAKPSMMSPDGGAPPPVHDHGAPGASPSGHGADDHSGAGMDPGTGTGPGAGHANDGGGELTVSAAALPGLIEPYLALQAALAEDDLEGARAHVREMMARTGHEGPLATRLHEMLAAGTLDEVREPHFVRLSAALIAAVDAHPGAWEGALLGMHCPMADGNRGADWLQADEPLRNPYFGAAMPGCGEIRQRFGSDGGEHAGHGH